MWLAIRHFALVIIAQWCVMVAVCVAEPLALPTVGFWNRYNNQVGVLECSNLGENSLYLSATLKSNAGVIVGTKEFDIPTLGTVHVPLANFTQANDYGTIIINSRFALTGHELLSCNTIFYRMAAQDAEKAIEYAFALPFRNPQSGPRVGSYNSMNVSGGSVPVSNWLSITNLSNTVFTGHVDVYGPDGVVDTDQSFVITGLAPGERHDFGIGHSVGQTSGMYRIVPADNSQSYEAFLTRYSLSDGVTYNFAFAIPADTGTCSAVPVPLSTMDPATNWVTISNARDKGVDVAIDLRDSTGVSRLATTVSIGAYRSHHIFVNQYLGERALGSLTASCLGTSSANKLIVESNFYGHPTLGSPDVDWAYVSQARVAKTGDNALVSVPYNTFLGSQNWAKFSNAKTSLLNLSFGLYDQQGLQNARRRRDIGNSASYDASVNELVGPNIAGVLTASTRAYTGSFTTELLRVFPKQDGSIGYIFNIPAQVVSDLPIRGGALQVAKYGHYFDYRYRKTLLVGDSVTQGWMELGTDFDDITYLDELASRGINATMLWSYIGIENQVADSRIGYNAPRRWPWRESTLSPTPSYSFQFTDALGYPVFNDAYFAALREFVSEANKRNITVLITVHDGWTKARFSGHPLNVSNGGPLTDRSHYVELANYNSEIPVPLSPTATWPERNQFYLEQFSDRLIRATADLPNVMYEIFNEGEWYDQVKLRAFQVHFLEYFKKRTDAPLLVNDDGVGGVDFREEPLVDAISLHNPNWSLSTAARDAFDHYSERFDNDNPYAKPIVFSEPVPEYEGGEEERVAVMRLMWGTLLGGAGFYAQDDSNWKIQNGVDPVLDVIGNAARFLHQQIVGFDYFTPDGSYSTTGVSFVNTEREFLLYSEYGETVKAFLAAGETFLINFFNPVTGDFDPDTLSIPGSGKAITLNKPTNADWVAWVVAQ